MGFGLGAFEGGRGRALSFLILWDIWAVSMQKARKVVRNISGHDFPLTS